MSKIEPIILEYCEMHRGQEVWHVDIQRATKLAISQIQPVMLRLSRTKDWIEVETSGQCWTLYEEDEPIIAEYNKRDAERRAWLNTLEYAWNLFADDIAKINSNEDYIAFIKKMRRTMGGHFKYTLDDARAHVAEIQEALKRP